MLDRAFQHVSNHATTRGRPNSKPSRPRAAHAQFITAEGSCLMGYARKGYMSSPALLPSPLTLMRNRSGQNMAEAAVTLGLSALCVARIEKHTRRLPAGTIRKWNDLFLPSVTDDEQMTIFDFMAAVDPSEEEEPVVF